ncbi:WD repeat, SAM and U-box domain-containing protein 1 isoform X3 [Lingula anatina]|uniref:WD repeat, SAM and U-box domain-containing protein 1 n=1 Tax=Lingula anatina TaxID=7574 RepID=A0A1S3JSR6_LINAN|nr:WD repeat, SAM and U-box domain-containing protein 1 isoform X2 [Lingula anatina]XP_013413415.1 WD repeat, SAM and U-box domain-containing protein 1 isoform X1 [Lingula anatina]XP_013413416.1 WD repeat, SAM and U-box domain-containing protein 1 isoform X3 [Lingula anatina]|eukprot:XP_013413414.1 WD repeat, SAM and U-box domain-containing protein 1 isoform X2 [Lingula anatina]
MLLTFIYIRLFIFFRSGDKTVRLWDPLKGEPLHTIEGHSRYVTCCAFSGDGKFLASGSNDKTVKIWKITSEEELTDTATYVDLLGSEEVLAQNKKPIEQWTVENVVSWVQELGLDQYADRFRKHAIDGTELAILTQEALEKDLEIDALGHRNKILRAVKQVMAHPIIQEKAASESDVPDEYLCPITREVMKEPVMASDGYTYERSAITAWVNSGKTSSPMTNATLPNMTLLPNRNMKMLIQRYLQERRT